MISVVGDAPATQMTVIWKVIVISELSTTQREDYREEYIIYKMNEFYVD